MFYDTWWHIITGGQEDHTNILAEVLDYDPDADKWTKVGEMAKARSYHGMSLVPAKTADYCVWYLGTEILCYDFIEFGFFQNYLFNTHFIGNTIF